MASIFTKIIAGEIPSYKIAEDENFYAFLDIMPVAEGHTLVVPKKETDDFMEMSADELSKILVFAQPIAKAIKKVIPCKKVALSVIGLEVPHAHLHLFPISEMSQANFAGPKLKPTPERMKEIQEKIVAALDEK